MSEHDPMHGHDPNYCDDDDLNEGMNPDVENDVELCRDCGALGDWLDVCGVCGYAMCYGCFEMGCGVCKGPHR